MTSRSDRDKVLDEVISALEGERTWVEECVEDGDYPLEVALYLYSQLYHCRKAVYMMMDDPGDNLE